ncbi:signal recognition particle protein [Candidatus Magnetaquicoccus inordinatus]|uniref:signal recognition particle protein n=1 Tax=Candidatus Magnetaquicoccus inordinatus TaxID=2496818 RepID=UPI00102ACDAE|nr:signal recognition particle protein [Candidatus Magnetaquicoccus inordinatus]
MFDALSDRFEAVFKKLRGRGSLNESNIQEAMREVRMALLEADVNLAVVKAFIARVSEKAIGREVLDSLTPGQQVIQVVYEELVQLMGEKNSRLQLATQPPAVVMMVGLQGSGKTTTTAKLASWLREKERKKCLLASLDVYRPAAMEQLATVGNQVNVATLPIVAGEKPLAIALRALDMARNGGYDVLFLDTAGRLHINEELMQELQTVQKHIDPVEILLVADAMTGQDAVTVSRSFNEQLDITGIVLTKTDGDARGGAALSIRQVTGKPIKFLGTGEALDKLEAFHPERLASRILGMGDVLTLVETAMAKVDLAETAKLQQKLQHSSFTLEDFLAQMSQVKKMGSISDLVNMIPGVKQAIKGQDLSAGEAQMKKTEAIILSMTLQERRKHMILNASRKKRIAKGSGTTVQDVNQLLKQFVQAQTLMKRLGRIGQKGMMRGGLGNLTRRPF